jgi:peptidase E
MLGAMTSGTILAMGGGGFSMEPDNPLLDDFLLSLAPSGRVPRVCFVPTASGDADGYVQMFQESFTGRRAETSVLSLFQRRHADLRSFLLGHDVVYVGGGNTANLLAVWRLHGVDEILQEALESGVVLAGLSAGMNCWFESSVTDSFAVDHLQPLDDGLGFLAGSACPHYDGEEARRPTYRRLVGSGRLPDGYAADDGCALLFENGKLADVVTSRPQARAFHVSGSGSGVVENPIDVRFLGDAG